MVKKLPFFKRILGDEFIAVSIVIIFGSLIKLGLGLYVIAITLFLVAALAFTLGVSIKKHM